MQIKATIAVLLLCAFFLPAIHSAYNDTELPPPLPPTQESPLLARALYSDGLPVQNSAIVLLIRANNSDTVIRTITDANGRFLLQLPQGAHDIDAILDLPLTPGIDFASTTSALSYSGSNATLIFYPSGSLSGRVLSDGAPVPSARVRISCPSNTFDYARINGVTEVEAGPAGEFMFRALPSGSCTASAYTGTLANSTDIQIKAGQTTSASISIAPKASLADSPRQNSDLPVLFFAVFGAIALIFIIYLAISGKLPAQPKSWQQKTKSAASSARKSGKPRKQIPAHGSQSAAAANAVDAHSFSSQKVSAVLSTLSEREGEILKFLLHNGGRAKSGHLAHKLLIPKTSVRRNLRSLERKNIIKIEPFGRNLLASVKKEILQ